MSKSDELLALAQRVTEFIPDETEKHTKATFKLNEDIAAALGWTLYNSAECEWKSPEGDIQQPPLYVTSFDAALTLVLSDHDWIVGDINGQVGGTPYAKVGPTVTCYAETAVLSLVAAALTARARLLLEIANV